ncbi:bifunctional 4-hydroxy-2-oxoglutarate aldolase/2-dehydro-3-deoxy-phosphogluconate aldolase [Dongia soli]|uniref:2-dehydro-3-deoxy-phosphogluconate aldolase n=1 Tax=Dongia soli TaxID=600628 RepID=A0ABU5EBA3_9PROT|nr:bifunctional 4-hydroxy-2-oxoglutarate aldolase/2-dehydro-3-deoxy-phosphogluconate aldolase [Dongia soli]MDY0883275.1 bifunctional 4-hydroxy-2-oxoglutarate aldolase/2-dehydro-3-deoxy-phosphogluconate aldolase [Dongia soli]
MAEFDMRNTLRETGVVPVVVMDSEEPAVPLAKCLVAAGVKMIEVTLRRPAAWKVMERVIAEVPEIIVGAGSVTNTSQLERLAKMGVRFAVSPGLTVNLIRAARNLNVPYLPGAVTASEILTGLEEGLTTLKFFPAELSGGVAMLNALRGPLPDVMFCPTGGIDVDNAATYASCPNVIAVGSSWVVPEGAIMAGQWQEIADRVERFRAIMRQEIAV